MKNTGDTPKNKKYYKIASGFRTAKYVSLIFLVIFLFGMYFIYSGEMTVDHFKYLIRNLEFNPNRVFRLGETVYFDSDEDNVCKSYKGGIAVLGGGKISLYDMTSSATLSEYHGYNLPSMVTSDKYILVFDRKNAVFSVYNAFSKLKDFTVDRPVNAAAISDEGTFVISMSDGEYYSRICIYNSNFELISNILLDKYVTSLDISENGETVLISSVYSGDSGALRSEIMIMDSGDKKARDEIIVDGAFILDCKYTGGGAFVALCDNYMRFYTKKGEEKSTVSYKDGFPDYSVIGESGVVFAYNKDPVKSETLIVSYDTVGKEDSRAVLSGRYVDMCVDSKRAYVLLDNSATSVSLSSGNIEAYPLPETFSDKKAISIMRSANEDVYVCGLSCASKLESN